MIPIELAIICVAAGFAAGILALGVTVLIYWNKQWK
jgi:hypothetical protein